jgi:hypothetical protein
MSEVTVVVSIGTGIGRGPRKGTQQSAAEFAQFEAATRQLLAGYGTIYVDGARSFGTDEKGQPEGGSTFVAGLRARDRHTVAVVAPQLRSDLAELAERHQQRCIAVTIGDTTFEGPGEE